ncbi:NADH dehydrogenase [ubiquinone] 1 alpha subcomplex subunit 5 [Diprion similis]|uniref:NADH dehydrogenase [ubiquinone] 1 alpha subcomplex subunit 5 n=1 Tax=Diprion similis TaxID=362088 RepID=UPI001EF812F7|nr:NADH dehydrogenase [ubiquinone] 1 alpha subcomplex subunit 5 [Diprion similis]
MAGVLKKSTNLTRVAVALNPHHTLGVLYSKILRAVDKMPKDYPYRINTEKIVKERAAHVKNNPKVPDLENAINCGQAEELILQAENELHLARKFLGWKPWEPLVQEAPANQWTWPPHK